jgi:hypothetical protein
MVLSMGLLWMKDESPLVWLLLVPWESAPTIVTLCTELYQHLCGHFGSFSNVTGKSAKCRHIKVGENNLHVLVDFYVSWYKQW